ncbi:MAG: GntR family transcriptional regulator [Clostridia bacterium]|jgi:DNA-binding FadR family transcriptional regulator|nr:GntR family transcriptional regulator [Clostridia bacterium]
MKGDIKCIVIGGGLVIIINRVGTIKRYGVIKLIQYNHNGKPLSEAVADDITHTIIIDKGLKPGDRIPSEAELLEFYDVSRSTIREAIKILTSRNIVEVKRGIGTFVAEKQTIGDDLLGFKLYKNNYTLGRDIFALRYMIEPGIAKMAALNRDEEDVKEIERLCKDVEKLISSGFPHLEKDREFHSAISSASKNLVISKLIPIINESIEVFIENTNNSLKQETIKTHRKIVEAIKSCDGEAAYRAMEEHLKVNLEDMTSKYESSNDNNK